MKEIELMATGIPTVESYWPVAGQVVSGRAPPNVTINFLLIETNDSEVSGITHVTASLPRLSLLSLLHPNHPSHIITTSSHSMHTQHASMLCVVKYF
jgi:hypothetical protein